MQGLALFAICVLLFLAGLNSGGALVPAIEAAAILWSYV